MNWISIRREIKRLETNDVYFVINYNHNKSISCIIEEDRIKMKDILKNDWRAIEGVFEKCNILLINENEAKEEWRDM